MATKTYQTSTPTDAARRAPHHNTPLEMTGLWSRAIGLLTAAGLFVALGLVGAVVLDAWQAAGLGLALALIVGVPGAILALYTRLEHGAAYGRREQPARPAGAAPIYLTQRLNVAGRPIDREPTPVNFGVDPADLDAALRHIRGGGATSRNAMTGALGISQGTWAKLMGGLETIGAVSNNGRAGIAADMGEIDRLLEELDAQW